VTEFALKTSLPQYLRAEQLKIEKFAREFGLDFFPIIFEILTYDQMNEIAAYGGFPNRYPHWRFGMEYEQLAKSYEYGLSKIYEMVINSNPAYAYLLEGNSLVDQKLVMAHVCAHVDFFKNNFTFRSTDLDATGRIDPVRKVEGYDPNRRWIDKMANHGSRIRRAVDRHGVQKVEEFIDQCLSLENLIDPWGPFLGRHKVPEDGELGEIEVPRLRSKDYMESFINPEEYLEEQRKKIEEQREREKRFPERPERDVLMFLLNHAPLERWERDVLAVVREEAYYFFPQMQTKIMNEGWACVRADTPVFTDRGLISMREIVEGGATSVSDGLAERRVYDQNVIRDHATVTVRTRRGFELCASNNHRVLAPDGVTWKRLDALALGDCIAVRGGAGLFAKSEVPLCWAVTQRTGVENAVDAVGLSAPMALRHRAGRIVGEGEALNAAVVLYDRDETQAIPQVASQRAPMRIPTRVTADLGAFLGYLVGGGHIGRAKRSLGWTTEDADQAAAFLRLGRDLFGLTASIERDATRWRVRLHSENLCDFLGQALGLTVGSSAREQAVPPAILRSPEPVVRAFLRAHFDCDGHAGHRGIVLRTSSANLARQTQLLLLNFGILSRCRARKDGGCRVHVVGTSAARFAENIGFGLARKHEALSAYLSNRGQLEEEEWDDEIVSIEHGRCDVYDISVEETHRYAAAGFVNHNSYWHSKMMTEKVLDASEIIDYADHNAGVLATSQGRLNPYKLGVELYRHVEDRWNKGQFGREWEECDSLEAKKHWDLRLGLGRRKIFEVRSLYSDVTFIDEFLTPEFCRDHKLFSFSWSNRNERYEIVSREFKQIKDKLLFQLTNAGNPFIYVEDANYENRGELLLRHEHQGVDLRADYAKETLRALVRVWKRPVSVATTSESKPTVIRYDGREHTSRTSKASG
jgi:stage V sporulation protein R